MSANTIKLLLVEFQDEVQTFMQYCQTAKLDPSSFTVIALQPRVRLYIKTHEPQLSCVDTLAYFNNQSHRRALEKSHQLTQSLAVRMAFDGSAVPETLTHTFIYYARFYINNYLRLFEILRGIKEAYLSGDTNRRIEMYAVDTDSTGWGSAFLNANDRFLSPIVRAFCQVHNISYIPVPQTVAAGAAKTSGSPSSEPSAISRPMTPGFLRKLAIWLLKRKLNRLAVQPTVFFSALSYNLDRLAHTIRKRYPTIIPVTAVDTPLSAGGQIKFCLKEIFQFRSNTGNGIITIPIDLLNPGNLGEGTFNAAFQVEKDQFVYDGCNFYEIFKSRVERGLMKHLHTLDQLAIIQQGILELLTPNAVISPVSIDTYMSWAECAGIQGIPAMIIPQKGLVAPENQAARLEQYYIGHAQVTGVFGYAAAQTPFIRNYLQWAEYKGEILETGNLIFSRINPKAPLPNIAVPENKHIIVYAPSMKSRKAHRFYVLETLDELMSSIEDVVNAAAALPDVHLIMRIHPGEPVTRREIEGLIDLPENVSISDSGTFEDVLSAAALTISFSSTSIQESLINGVPVVLFDKWNRYNHLDAPEVKDGKPGQLSSSYYVNRADYLRPTLRWILDNHTEAENEVQLFYDCIFQARYRENFMDFIKHCIDQDLKN